MENIETKKRKISFAPAITFFCLEVLAIVAFSLGNSYVLFGSLGIVLAILFLVIYLKQIKIDKMGSFAYFLFPIVLFGFLTAISPFAKYDLNVATAIFIPLTILCFSFSGYLVSYSERFSVRHAMIIIYGAIALYSLINLFVTMIQFVPFYPLIYGNGTIYYDGQPSIVKLSGMAYALMGFELTEVTIGYFSLFPTLLLTAAVGLFFVKYKEDKISFVLLCVYTFIGFISLLFTFSKVTIIGDAIVALVILLMVLFGKGKINGKTFRIIMAVFGGLLALFVIVFFINSQRWPMFSGLQNLILNNGFLNRIFNGNGYAAKFKPICAELFSSAKFLGYPNGAALQIVDIEGNPLIAFLSGSWFFDNFMTSGVIGAALFIFAIVVAFKNLIKYFKLPNEDNLGKNLLVTFVITYFVYSLVNNDTLPFVFFENSLPIVTQSLFVICLFLISYTFNKVSLSNSEQKEEINNEKE